MTYHAAESPGSIGTRIRLELTIPNQSSLWILEIDYGQFNDLDILQCERKKKLNELSRRKVSNLLVHC